MVKFKVQFAKQIFELEMPEDATVGEIKEKLEGLSGIPPDFQKLMKGGILKSNTQTLKDVGIVDNTKLMLIGSKSVDILEVNLVQTLTPTDQPKEEAQKHSISQDDIHKKIIEKGVPEDAEPGDRTKKLRLPPSLKSIVTKGGKVRLTFKTDVDELWIASATSTQKLPYNSIRAIHSEPIIGHENYHIMSMQIGSTEATKYWFYFVPAQYVEAIKNEILGNFPLLFQ